MSYKSGVHVDRQRGIGEIEFWQNKTFVFLLGPRFYLRDGMDVQMLLESNPLKQLRQINHIFSSILFIGSHDSAAYKFELDLGVYAGKSKLVQRLGNTRCGKPIVSNWSKTQNLSITQQLESGIRYFDFRVALHPDTKERRFVHGLHAGLVTDGLSEINKFLDTYTKEVVILHFQHVQGFCKCDHGYLMKEIGKTFKEKCFQRGPEANGQFLSLEALLNTKYRVMIFYREDAYTKEVIAEYPYICGDSLIKSPWGNKNDIDELIQYLQDNYDKMQKEQAERNTMYVWQGLGSPKAKDICLHLCSTLESVLASEATARFVDWLKDGKISGPKGINICIADFVEKHDYISTVINLNTL